jgi:hypothetical protein
MCRQNLPMAGTASICLPLHELLPLDDEILDFQNSILYPQGLGGYGSRSASRKVRSKIKSWQEQIGQQLQTSLIGPMMVTRAVLPVLFEIQKPVPIAI